MNNQSALDRLKEIEAEKKELQSQMEQELTFPFYTKSFNGFAKIESKFKSTTISTGVSVGVLITDFTEAKLSTVSWDHFNRGESVISTPEEFEAARSEAINKLSNL